MQSTKLRTNRVRPSHSLSCCERLRLLFVEALVVVIPSLFSGSCLTNTPRAQQRLHRLALKVQLPLTGCANDWHQVAGCSSRIDGLRRRWCWQSYSVLQVGFVTLLLIIHRSKLFRLHIRNSRHLIFCTRTHMEGELDLSCLAGPCLLKLQT